DRFERLQEARVVGREEPQVQQLQYAGVEIVSRESGGEALRLRAPGGLLDMGPDMIGTFLPELGSLGQVECHRRVRQTIAGSPAHRRRIRVNALPGSELPQAGIGLIVLLPGALADALQCLEVLASSHAEEPLIKEGLDVAKNDLAVGIVLDLLIGLVADPNRPHATIPGKGLRSGLRQ